MYAFFIEASIIFIGIWAFLIFAWNWPAWYVPFLAGSHLKPGEIYACVFIPILAFVVLFDIISKYADMCSGKCLKKK